MVIYIVYEKLGHTMNLSVQSVHKYTLIYVIIAFLIFMFLFV